jgi:hypothetical protein
VTKDHLPFGTWDTSTNTWTYTGLLVFPSSDQVIYYVEGNAMLGSIQLAGGTSAMIVTRGFLVFDTLALVTTSGLSESASVKFARGPNTASVTVNVVVADNSQTLVMLAEKELSIGRPILSLSPLTFDTENQALLNATTGIGLTASNLALNNYIQGYSETATAWAKVSAIDALSTTKGNFCGNGDTTLAFNGSIGSSVSYYPPKVF